MFDSSAALIGGVIIKLRKRQMEIAMIRFIQRAYFGDRHTNTGHTDGFSLVHNYPVIKLTTRVTGQPCSPMGEIEVRDLGSSEDELAAQK